MEYVLVPILWLIGLFDTQSSDPVVHARKMAKLSACLCAGGSFVLLFFSYLLSSDFSAGSTVTLPVLVNNFKELISLGFALTGLFFSLIALWNIWIYYRTHTRPDLF